MSPELLTPPDEPGVRRQVLLAVALLGLFVALQAGVLLAFGQATICRCGYVALWYPEATGPETSQHLTDWYTLSHVQHGFIFYALLWLLLPRASVPIRLALAIGIEAAWEIAENTPAVIDRYRQTALAQGYFGDSVVNSLADTAAAALGFVLARLMLVWWSVLLVVAIEVLMLWAIRDSLSLNIIQLVWPLQAISDWQVGG